MGTNNFFKDTDIYKLTARMVVFTVLMIGLCRLTRGYIMPVYALVGVLCALANQLGWALVFIKRLDQVNLSGHKDELL